MASTTTEDIVHLALRLHRADPAEDARPGRHLVGRHDQGLGAFEPIGTLGTFQTVGVDGTVTGVPTGQMNGAFVAIDFGAVSKATDGGSGMKEEAAFIVTDNGTGSASPEPNDFQIDPTGAHTTSRALVGLGNGQNLVAIWSDLVGGLYSASFPGGSPQLGAPLGSGPVDNGTWAACAESNNVHVVWNNNGIFNQLRAVQPVRRQRDADMGAQAVPAQARRSRERRLPYPPGTILKASWNGGASWSPWTVAVAPPTSGQRCYLSGFDRVVTTTVGLIWTEASSSCDLATATSLSTAVVPVP